MTPELELTILLAPAEDRGYLAGFAITDQLIVAAGGTSSRSPTLLVSSNARHFEARGTPRDLGLRDVLVVDNAIWVCGEYGHLAASRDQGATWRVLDTGTDGCLCGLARGHDGAMWVVGEKGFAARVGSQRVERVDLGTGVGFTGVQAFKEELVVLGSDGALRRWHRGEIKTVATGSTKALKALAWTRSGTWVVVGDAGFIARSPDGAWFSRAKSGVDVELEAIAAIGDGKLVAVGDRGFILASSDDGRTWMPVRSETTVHLWSVERFGPGALIGGDQGAILKLAPPGDQTWHDRVNVFGGGLPLDALFAAGPEGFVAGGLARYLDALGHGQSDQRGGEDTVAFEASFGMPMPPEARRFFDLLAGCDRTETFHELRLDAELLAGDGDNLFERVIARDQGAYLRTGLVEAFCGVICLGSQGNGDTYHLELYEWNGPRQVVHWDHDAHQFTCVFADSLDSLVFLAALCRAEARSLVSADAMRIALRKLYGKVAPTWHFGMDERDPDLVALDAKRRETEFFHYRARWICALLHHDGVTEIADIPALFSADLNQSLPPEQLPTRLEMCEKYIPTALYSMWRAYLFDEPELGQFLDVGRTHRARLVRDAVMLIEELAAGRRTLGTIADWPAHLAAFRALDLDPRRAGARKAEAVAARRVEDGRREEAAAELARTPREAWADLAWRWLGDGAAHRALLEKLDALPETAEQIAAIDGLARLRDVEREAVLPLVAEKLGPELEAVLVGSLLRDDALAGVLKREEIAEEGDDSDEDAAGWDAIDGALEPVYRGAEPHAHYGTVLPYRLGGNDPLHGISVYLRTDPVPHFHFVTYGFTDLFAKETDDPEESGFGFELTFRLARRADDEEVPAWPLNFLQNLGRYVFGTGNRFATGHKMGLNGPIALDRDTRITAVLFTDEPELGAIDSQFGKARFLQVVGITDDEYKLIQEWSTPGLVEVLRRTLPMLVTDLGRRSVLDDPALRAEIQTRVDAEGSSEDLTFAGELAIQITGEHLRLELGALYAAAFPRAMRGRIRHARSYKLRGRAAELVLEPAAQPGWSGDGDHLELRISPELAREIEARMQAALANVYRFETWPSLEIEVTPSFIRDQQGKAIDIRGIADEALARRMIAEENARLAAQEAQDDEGDGDDNDDDDDDGAREIELVEDDAPPLERVHRALGMTERALRLQPQDTDAQFAHAMLLIDAYRGGDVGRMRGLIELLPRSAPAVRVNVAVRLALFDVPELGEVLDIVLANELPVKILGESGGGAFTSYGDIARELYVKLADAVLDHAPDRIGKLVPHVPADVTLLSDIGWKAIQNGQRDAALAVYERLLALPVPDTGEARTNYLRSINNACVQAHAAKAYDVAVRIADRAQPYAQENPHIFHAAACAYVAGGDLRRALDQVRLAIEHGYEHLDKLEVDTDLRALLDWPEYKALFRDYHARREGN
jgi:suppressor of fused-like protein